MIEQRYYQLELHELQEELERRALMLTQQTETQQQ